MKGAIYTANYWQDREAKAQQRRAEKSIKDIEKQLREYYNNASLTIIEEFENTYYKLLATAKEGRAFTPADLYNLDKYWSLQGQVKEELLKLGDKQIELLTKRFTDNYIAAYLNLSKYGGEAFATIDRKLAEQAINAIWCADGKSWSQRIWKMNDYLASTLNDELVNVVITGKSPSDLKRMLKTRFGVSYSQADSLVRTEIAHIQTEAAKKRYEDYGIQMVQIWADEDERRCPECGKLHKKIYPVGAAVPIPAHPRCRCCIVPVID